LVNPGLSYTSGGLISCLGRAEKHDDTLRPRREQSRMNGGRLFVFQRYPQRARKVVYYYYTTTTKTTTKPMLMKHGMGWERITRSRRHSLAAADRLQNRILPPEVQELKSYRCFVFFSLCLLLLQRISYLLDHGLVSECPRRISAMAGGRRYHCTRRF
jgi:hypothetical protein